MDVRPGGSVEAIARYIRSVHVYAPIACVCPLSGCPVGVVCGFLFGTRTEVSVAGGDRGAGAGCVFVYLTFKPANRI